MQLKSVIGNLCILVNLEFSPQKVEVKVLHTTASSQANQEGLAGYVRLKQ